ncbi:GTP 3',8-cyclase MoaA [Roseimicrobium sp. ORNL1]|uniref:GTP 3',8-cyclase MoaA n=1 Tax=Roseimicrobium sp. ORNL1 TaxID=2711231 RepID=UPI0013E15692|nr:GTP 3',8-cyclase MoaA [Roseimicrobium sp. ORNL1]QIF01331.1 GTP 3',8-cyclase MoaA [Roseimicrobium sp. ORNL1]
MYSESGTAPTATTVSPVVRDGLGRALTDLRLSVTDRCNFRCTYCMPKELFGASHAFLPKSEILSFEELARIAQVFVGLGVEKIRLTGGEPLLRRELDVLIARLAAIPGVQDLTLTTNGSALVNLAPALRAAGLSRLTVSVDALDDAVFRAMNDVDFPVHRVLAGIDAALEAGFGPIKINTVVKRGVNEQEILPLVRRFRGPQYVLRFIEYMDVGNSNGWRMEHVVPAREILQRIEQAFPLEPLPAHAPSEVARRYRHRDGGGEIGVISSVTAPFCRDCTRARVSSDGKLYTCLFNGQGHDLRSLLRDGATDEELADFVRGVWHKRDDRYSELRAHQPQQPQQVAKAEMSRIGG